MKSKNDFRKPVKNESYDSDELRKAKKLKPVKKDKNVKRSLFHEIDEDEDLDVDIRDSLMDEEIYDEDAYDEDEEDY
ncbi:MAG: hypothetical protein H6536_07635 [Bacteroidales bacterium]|nr:hypothetical protein [Bacteroidales bacterium]